MTRFGKNEAYDDLSFALAQVFAEFGLDLVRADWHEHEPQIWSNVCSCMGAANYGVAVFEGLTTKALSPKRPLKNR